MKENTNIVLISFYNPKSLGLRYIENSLKESGYNINVIFFKDFNSVNPKRATTEELELLNSLVKKFDPIMIGLSVMTSLYLETVETVNKSLKENFKVPIIWGGVYATMFPEDSIKNADFVIRSEGEEPFAKLADEIKNETNNFSSINNLVYKSGEEIITNELGDLILDLDAYGIPDIGSDNKYFIEDNKTTQIDPQINSFNYELSASRGCPFVCSYCCAVNLKRINAQKGPYVRFRTVDRVIEELLSAKEKVKHLKVIHFWDEIFSDSEEWIDEFVKRYKTEINLPFEIWGHPLKTNDLLIGKLKSAGLYKVVMGIQSGSYYIRREIFKRPEKQEDIIEASKVLSRNKVPQVIYDFMLRHPFETHETLKETYDLCLQLAEPFELQLHGLNFLPGTDIVDMALESGLVSKEQMEKYMYSSIEEQYDMYWARENSDPIANFWYENIYLTQFSNLRKQSIELVKDPTSKSNQEKASKLYKQALKLSKLRYLQKKAVIVVKGTFPSLNS